MEQKAARIQEIYRRGLQDRLPPEKRQIADELIRRGVVQIEQPIQEIEQPKDMSLSGLHKAETSVGEAYGKQALESSTLGLGSRIVPGISAGIAKLAGYGGGAPELRDVPISELYKEARDIYKKEEKVAREEHPVASFAGDITGAIASPINVATLKAVKMAGGGLKGAIAGATGEGALAGLGYTEDMAKPREVLKDIGTGALVGGALGGTLYGIGKGIGVAVKPLKRFTPAKRKVVSEIKSTLKKEGVNPTEALRKMNEEGLDLIDVVDPRSALVSSLPQKSYEKATIDQVDSYVNRLNIAGNKAKNEVLDMVSKNKISADDGALLLGRNAQKVIDDQFKIRTAKARPLYDKAFKSTKEIMKADDEFLQRPVIQDAIAKVRAESTKFGDTAIGNIKDLPDNSLPVLHQAKGFLYRKSKDFTDLEAKRYADVYSELSQKLQKNPLYEEATKSWAGETEGLEQLYKQKGIGNIAKKYMNNDIDGIKSSMKNVFNKSVSNEELTRIKNSMNPEDFNRIVRRDLETLVDEAGDKGSNLTTSLFGKGEGERSLKNKRLDLLFNSEEKKGLKKMANALDLAGKRMKEAEKLRFGVEAKATIPITKYGALNKLGDTLTTLLESPAHRKEYVNFLTSQEGKNILIEMAKGNGSRQQIYNRILTINRIINQQIQEKDSGTSI
jgi:hypothetical protein